MAVSGSSLAQAEFLAALWYCAGMSAESQSQNPDTWAGPGTAGTCTYSGMRRLREGVSNLLLE